MNLDAKSGLTVTGGDLDNLDLEITEDLVTDNAGTTVLFDDIVVTEDYAGLDRVDLDAQLTLTADDDDVERFLNFAEIGGAEVINVISQLRGLADRLPNTDIILGGGGIPYLDSVVGENVDFAKLIRDS